MRSRVRIAIWLLIGLPLLLGGGVMTVQGQDGECAALVQQVYTQLEAQCGDLAPGYACYGAGAVAVERRADLALTVETPFAQPGDVIAVRELAALTTQGYDPASNTWGAALVRLQPGAPVEAETLAAPPPDEAPPTQAPTPTPAPQFTVPAGVTVTAATGAVTAGGNVNLRGGPGTTYDVVGTLTAGQQRGVIGQADGADGFVWLRLDDGEWVRSDIIAYDPAGVVAPAPAADSAAGGAAQATSQDDGGIVTILLLGEAQLLAPPVGGPLLIEQGVFDFSTGPDAPGCDGIPLSHLFIETTPGSATPLLINGLLVVFQSTALATAQPGDRMTLSTLVGELTVVDGGFTGAIPQGATQPLTLGGADGFDTLGSGGHAMPNGAYWGDAIYPGDLPPLPDGSTFGSGPIPSLTVQPQGITLLPGQQQQYWCIGQNQYGFQYPVPASSWEAGGGAITGDGLFTAGQGGDAYVGCYLGGYSLHGSTDVPILGNPPPTGGMITINPSDAMFYTGDSGDFYATLDDGQGNSYPVSPTWSAGGGLLTPHYGVNYTATQPGDFTLTAEVIVGEQPITGTAQITVGQAPESQLARVVVSPSGVTLRPDQPYQFTATGYDQSGNPMPVNPSWSGAGGGDVFGGTSSDGEFIAEGPGTFTVEATQDGVTGTATVVVSDAEPQLARIVVSPANVTIRPNQPQQFTATGYDQSGNTIALTPSWSASGGDEDVFGGTSSDGEFVAEGPGTFTVEASQDGVTGTATVVVSDAEPQLARIVVSPAHLTIQPGVPYRFTATGYDQFGNTLAISPSWIGVGGPPDADAGVAADGEFVSEVAGTFTVEASQDGVTGTATVVVDPAPDVSYLDLAPEDVVLRPGDEMQFTASAQDAEGFPAAWLIMAWQASGGVIDDDGRYIAPGEEGDYTITVTTETTDGETLTQSTTVSVQQGPERVLTRLTVEPLRWYVPVQPGWIDFTATGYDQFDDPMPVDPVWSISGEGLTQTGHFTAFTYTTSGTYTVTATEDGVSGSSSVEVSPLQVRIDTLLVHPRSAALHPGETVQFDAMFAPGGGQPAPVEFTWSANGGSITRGGSYTAPDTPGTYYVSVSCATPGGTVMGVTVLVEVSAPY